MCAAESSWGWGLVQGKKKRKKQNKKCGGSCRFGKTGK